MPFDTFDNKIKDSLEDGSPAYNESSWLKMKFLLDKHMPQNNNSRRKLIIFIFFFLLLGGGTAILLNMGKTENIALLEINKLVPSKTTTIKEPETIVDKNEKQNIVTPLINKMTKDGISVINNSITSNKTRIPENETSIVIAPPNQANPGKETDSKKESAPFSIYNDQQKRIAEVKSSNTENELLIKQEPSKTIEVSKNEIGNIETPSNKEKDDLLEKNISKESVKKYTKKQQSILNNIFFFFSTGPDISSVGNNTGKLQMMLGAGLGFKISDRLIIRSGLFTGNKNYIANPEDYNPPSNFWAYYPNLKSVNADCKVLDIPINIDFNFGISKSWNGFVSAGVSNLIMKKEEYNYYYKPVNSSQYIYYTRTYKNENTHYFSILNFSGGVSRKISPILTLQAEPYLKIALNGVGYGKVKLNSTGVLLSARIQPFQ